MRPKTFRKTKINIFLFGMPDTVSTTTEKWYALYVNPRAEKKVADRMAARGYNVYVPLTESIRTWSDRKKKVLVPILPSYVFVKTYFEKFRDAILQEPGVRMFVYEMGKPAIIKSHEITAMQNFLDKHSNVSGRKLEKNIGDKAQVILGVLKDKQGTVVRVTKKSVYLQIESIGYELIAEVNPDMIEILKSSK